MQVLVIGYVWPEPNSSAAGQHILSIMQCFTAQGWQVEFASPAQQTPHMVDLAEHGIKTTTIALNCDSFDDYVAQLQPNIVLFDRFMMEEQFGWRIDQQCPSAFKILDTEDLQSLRHLRHKLKGQPARTHDYHNELAIREIAAIYRCDLSLIISPAEHDLLLNTYDVTPHLLHTLPFMTNIDQLPSTPSFEQRDHFVTIGNFRHAPNWDSVLLLQQLWPQIRKQLPYAELHIYGSYPPPKATALTNTKNGFIVKGWAENAHDVIKNAKVMLSPLRFGAGIKGKFLDAMRAQTPSVTTDIGSEGMTSRSTWPGCVENEPKQIVHAAVELYRDHTLWQQKSDLCHSILAEEFDKRRHAARLIEKIESVHHNLTEHRLSNFTGTMLKHHIHGSKKYMAQWINEKNRNKDNNDT